MGMLLCEQNVRDVWIRNESGGQKLVKFCTRTDTHPHTHTHTTAAKLVVRLYQIIFHIFYVSEMAKLNILYQNISIIQNTDDNKRHI